MIYFIRAPIVGLIKIGFTGNVKKRFTDLSRMSPVKLELIAIHDGELSDEQELHKRFDAIRDHDEWFHPEQELIDYIDQNGRPFSDLEIVESKAKRAASFRSTIETANALEWLCASKGLGRSSIIEIAVREFHKEMFD